MIDIDDASIQAQSIRSSPNCLVILAVVQPDRVNPIVYPRHRRYRSIAGQAKIHPILRIVDVVG
jgi:hypothetical protein